MSPLDEFTIEITVRHLYKNYTLKWDEPKQGCNHIDNIPGTADYMGQEILKQIKENNHGNR